MKNGILLFLFGLFLTSNMFAQNLELGDWLQYYGNKKYGDKWNIHHELQYRNYNAIGDLEQLLVRGGIGYNLTDNNNNILFGAAYIYSQNYKDEVEGIDDKENITEFRTFQQFTNFHKVSKLYVEHRLRVEQRWIREEVENLFKMRYRYFLSLHLPINHTELIDNTWYASTYNEIFLNNNSDNTFDRNRTYVGIGYKLNEKLKLEAGYMNQFFDDIPDRDQVNLMVFYTF